VVLIFKRPSQRCRLRSRRSRAAERGATIFIVLLVLTVLTAVGVISSRIAGLNQRSAGYDRQATQTGYVADYALLASLDEMNWGTTGAKPYYDLMMRGTESCTSNQYVDSGVEGGMPCYKIFKGEIQSRLQQSGSSVVLFDYDGGSLGPGPAYDPGKSQPGNAQPDWVVELTDPGPAGPVAGTDQGGTGIAGKYVQMTVTGVGQVRPRSAGQAACGSADDKAAAMSAGTKTTRAIARVPIL